MPPSDGEINTRAEAIRNLQMAENELARHPSIAKAVRIEMHTRIAGVWASLALADACAVPRAPMAEAAPLAQSGASRPRTVTDMNVSQIIEAFHQAKAQDEAPEPAPEPAPTPAPEPAHVPGRQWRDVAGDVWTAVGYLDRGDVLVTSGDPDDLIDWPNASPIPEVDLYTLEHVASKWGPLDEIQPSVDKETTGE